MSDRTYCQICGPQAEQNCMHFAGQGIGYDKPKPEAAREWMFIGIWNNVGTYWIVDGPDPGKEKFSFVLKSAYEQCARERDEYKRYKIAALAEFEKLQAEVERLKELVEAKIKLGNEFLDELEGAEAEVERLKAAASRR